MGKSKEQAQFFHTFMTDTTIHGCRYIVDSTFSRLSNFLWLLVEVAAFTIGIYLILVVPLK